MLESHIAHQKLCRGMNAFVEIKAVGMKQMYPGVGRFACIPLALCGFGRHGKRHAQEYQTMYKKECCALHLKANG